VGCLQVTCNNGTQLLRRMHVRRVHKFVSTRRCRVCTMSRAYNSPISDIYVASIKRRNALMVLLMSRAVKMSRNPCVILTYRSKGLVYHSAATASLNPSLSECSTCTKRLLSLNENKCTIILSFWVMAVFERCINKMEKSMTAYEQ
jgi:hypothetical protein